MMDDRSSNALDRLSHALGKHKLARVEMMERITARFLTTQWHKDLEKTLDDTLCTLLQRTDPSKPRGAGNRREGAVILVLGETGAGKTRAVRRLLGKHPAYTGFDEAGDDDKNPSAIHVEVTAPGNFLSIGMQILEASGYPVIRDLKGREIRSLLTDRLKMLGTTVLYLDEMHSVTDTAKVNEIEDLLAAIKGLVANPVWPIIVIISGLPRLTDFIEKSREVTRRTRPVACEELSRDDGDDREMLAALILELADMAQLKITGAQITTLIPRLIHAASSQLGYAITLIHRAIGSALDAEVGRLSIQHFAEGYADCTKCGPGANPFLVPDWCAVKPLQLLRKDSLPAPRLIQPKAKRTKAKGDRG
ncbi:ATP-binding protein [Methylobacterium sp. E-025]|uniref:ATP-binding protein n=1 Tax=Methylobacterium sp. E-025 TaxID=2836561 RepID=UPI001FB9D2D4|nr:ATP-binding protein [Methylobacterium sp. E-025]MCJ2113603.1 ATP-binding protein [Methylobacterium sp. E-025]